MEKQPRGWKIIDKKRACFMGYPLVNVTKNDGKSPFLMGKLTISMAMFNSKLFVYQRVVIYNSYDWRFFPWSSLIIRGFLGM